MKNSIWHKEERLYQLENNFNLKKAEAKEFSIFSAIYRKNNNWFRQSFDKLFSLFADNDNCFWILKNNKRIGGVIIEPNMMGWLFFIPPFCDKHNVLSAIVKTLRSWSDPNKNIYAHGVMTNELKCYFRTGFRLTSELCYAKDSQEADFSWNFSCVMIRPTQKYEINFEENCVSVDLRDIDVKALGEFFHKCFNNGKSKEHFISSCEGYFSFCNEVTLKSSTILLNKTNNEIIGACLISLWEEWPNIYDIAVHPSHRGNGYAGNMIKKSIELSK